MNVRARGALGSFLAAALLASALPAVGSFVPGPEGRTPGAPAGGSPPFAGLAAQAVGEGAFVTEMAADTFAVENFTRAPDRVAGELAGLAFGRMVYELSLGPEATVVRLALTAWMPGIPPEEAPAQEAEIELRGDSAIVEIQTPAGPQTQRLGTTKGALPYLNPSFVLVEQIIRRARALGEDPATVPLFMVQGGQTVDATVRSLRADSVVVAIAGSEIRAEVDAEGRILSAAIPVQNLRITRIDGRHVSAPRAEAPDYSAPEDAPYVAEEVRIETAAGHTLAGTLTLPAVEGAVPAAILITGSGAQDRDQAIPMVRGYRPFREIADTLSRRGVAVLRVDDRGFGASTGDFAGATSAEFADDVRAAVRYLRDRAEVDGSSILLIGHSEGGMIAPMLAAEDPALRGIVLIGAPSRTGREIIAHQQRHALERAGTVPQAELDSALAAQAAGVEEAAARQPWLRFFLDYDPLPTARAVSEVPVLILHGETDRQVPVDQAPLLGEAFRAGGNLDVTVRTFSDVNHLMLDDPDGSPAGYAALESTGVAPELLGTLVDWVVERAGG
jgi:uncharacterized protein